MLNELAREYRHRVVHPAAITPVTTMHQVLIDGRPLPASAMEILPRERLKDGDVVLRFTVPESDAGANVEPHIVLAVGIDHAITRGLPSTRVLNEIGLAVEAALNDIAPFLDP
jgi:hypothetical protein